MLRFVEMNLTKPVFKDVRVRQALNYAVNKEALVKVAFAGYADVAEGIAPLSVDYAVKLGPWPYDPQKAKALLKEAGYPNGFEVELWSGYNHTTAPRSFSSCSSSSLRSASSPTSAHLKPVSAPRS